MRFEATSDDSTSIDMPVPGARALDRVVQPAGWIHAVTPGGRANTLCGLDMGEKNMPVWPEFFDQFNPDRRCAECVAAMP